MAGSSHAAQPVAVIDVGTNSVKLLVANVRGPAVEALYETSDQTRLGAGFYQSRMLRPDSIEATARAVGRFVEKARSLGASRIVCVGTSAARDASNSEALAYALWTRAGMELRVLTGDEEAELAFEGVLSDSRLDGRVHLAADVGGGSTELILGDRTKVLARQSFPLGAVRLAEQFPMPESPSPEDYARCRAFVGGFIKGQMAPFLESERGAQLTNLQTIISACGTSTILARMHLQVQEYDRDRLDGCRIESSALEQLNSQLWNSSLTSRRQIIGLPADRADIMPFGTLIFDCILGMLGASYLIVSLRGLRFGLATRLAHGPSESN